MLAYIIILSVLGNLNCRDLYLNKALESRNINQYYIVVQAELNKTQCEIMVLSYNLHDYLKEKDRRCDSMDQYKKLIKEKIDHKEAILLDKPALRKMQAALVKEDSSVMAVASKGKAYFINYYFNVSSLNTYARLKFDVADEKLTQIVKTLFEWNYLVEIVEGNLQINTKGYCE